MIRGVDEEEPLAAATGTTSGGSLARRRLPSDLPVVVVVAAAMTFFLCFFTRGRGCRRTFCRVLARGEFDAAFGAVGGGGVYLGAGGGGGGGAYLGAGGGGGGGFGACSVVVGGGSGVGVVAGEAASESPTKPYVAAKPSRKKQPTSASPRRRPGV